MNWVTTGLCLLGFAGVGYAAISEPNALSASLLLAMGVSFLLLYQVSAWLTDRSHRTTMKAFKGWETSSDYARKVTIAFFAAVDCLSTYDREEADRLTRDVMAAATKGRYELNWMED